MIVWGRVEDQMETEAGVQSGARGRGGKWNQESYPELGVACTQHSHQPQSQPSISELGREAQIILIVVSVFPLIQDFLRTWSGVQCPPAS